MKLKRNPQGLSGKIFILLEIVMAFVFLDLFNHFLVPDEMGFLTWIMHPYWIVILLMSTRYGFWAGLASGLISGLHYYFFLFGDWPSESDFEVIAQSQQMLLPVAFMTVGVILGGIRQKQMEQEAQKEKISSQRQQTIDRLEGALKHNEKIREIFSARIIGEVSTVKRLYEISRQLESLEAEQILKGCLQVLEQHFRVQKATIYIREAHGYLVKSRLGDEQESDLSSDVSQDDWFHSVLSNNRPMMIHEFLEANQKPDILNQNKLPLAAFPLHNSVGQPIGIAAVEKMDFYYFNQTHLNTIGLIIDWMGQSLERAKLFNSMKGQFIYDEDHDMYTYSYFQDVLKSEFLRARSFGLDLTVSLIKLDNFRFLTKESQRLLTRAMSALLKRYIAKTDMIFRYRVEGVFAVVSPMRKKQDIAPEFEQVVAGLKELCQGELLSTLYKPDVSTRMTELHDIQDPIELMGLKVKENE